MTSIVPLSFVMEPSRSNWRWPNPSQTGCIVHFATWQGQRSGTFPHKENISAGLSCYSEYSNLRWMRNQSAWESESWGESAEARVVGQTHQCARAQPCRLPRLSRLPGGRWRAAPPPGTLGHAGLLSRALAGSWETESWCRGSVASTISCVP